MLGKIDLSKNKVHNNFKFVLKDTKDGSKKEYFAENIVLDQAREKMFERANQSGHGLYRILVGTGQGTIEPSRTNLFNEVASKDYEVLSRQYAFPVSVGEYKAVFGTSEIVGEELSEIGLSFNQGSENHALFTHALIQDSEGNPITIPSKTDTQILEIYSTIYVEQNENIKGFSLVSPDNPYSRGIIGTQSGGGAGPVLRRVRFPYSGTSLDAQGENDLQNLKRNHGPLLWDTGTGNGNLGSTDHVFITLGNAAAEANQYNIVFFPNTDIFPAFTFEDQEIGVGDGENKYFNFESGHYIHGSETVKVDGVEQIEGSDYVRMPFPARQDFLRLYGKEENFPHLPKNLIVKHNDFNGEEIKPDIINKNIESPTTDVVVDLKEKTPIKRVRFSGEGSAGFRQWQISDDGENWSSNVDVSSSITLDKIYSQPIVTRYLRFQSTSNVVRRLSIYTHGSIKFLDGKEPADGAVVTASWETDIPPKTENILYNIDWVVQY